MTGAKYILIAHAVALSLLSTQAAAQAQDFPSRPVKLIVPFAPGGGVDIVARLVAPKLSELWGQSVVVENRAGAGGGVASEYVAHQAPDGHTLLIGVIGSHAIAQYLSKDLTYDPVRDFAGVTALVYSPVVCLVSPSGPYRILKDLVEDAKRKPVTYGSPGAGSQPHLIGETFNLEYGTQFEHIVYRGVAPAMQDLMGGHIPVVFGEMGSSKPLIAAEKLRALAVTGTERNPSVPDVPTFGEAGFSGFEVNSFFALFVPAATPKPVVARIAADATKVVRAPELSARLLADGWEAGGGTPDEFTKFWLDTAAHFGRIIEQRHITIE